MHARDQTIFALSSGRLPSAIAIVRVSGPAAGAALELLAGKIPTPRIATRADRQGGRPRSQDYDISRTGADAAQKLGQLRAEDHILETAVKPAEA